MSGSNPKRPGNGEADKHDNYDVGYKKPPKHTQFGHGVSGNPRGREPGSRNFSTLLERVLQSKIQVTEKNKKRAKRKDEVIVVQLVNKALGGDFRALALIIEMAEKNSTRAQKAQRPYEASVADAEADAQVVADFLLRAREGRKDE